MTSDGVVIEQHEQCGQASCLGCSLLRVLADYVEMAGVPSSDGGPGKIVDTSLMVDALGSSLGHMLAVAGHEPHEVRAFLRRSVEVALAVYVNMDKYLDEKDKARPVDPNDLAVVKPAGSA